MRKLILVVVLCIIATLVSTSFVAAGMTSGVSLDYVLPIQGDLQPGQTDTYGPFHLFAGSPVVVQLNWVTSDSTVSVSLRACGGLRAQVVTLTGGNGTAQFHVKEFGHYCVAVRNSGLWPISYSGTIFLDAIW